MSQFMSSLRRVGMALVFAAAALLAAPSAHADKLHLKDGRVLQGRVQKEADGVVWFVVVVGKIEQTQLFTSDEIKEIERDTPAGDAAKAADAKPDAGKTAAAGGATRVAILNFGPPSSWQGKVENMVGREISAQAWKDAVPLLEKDHIQVVVVRVNSGGGMAIEVPKFHEVFQNEYKPRFRTVAWIESAISAAAMAPYVLEEMYFMPEGNLGACTMFSGRLVMSRGQALEEVLAMMEKASASGGRDYKIMRSMQIQEPLSCSIDKDTGEVTWYQDVSSGQFVVNGLRPDGKAKVLTLNAQDAVKFKFAKGIAATPDELMKAMGIQEYVIAGQKATDYIDDNMRKGDQTTKHMEEVYRLYNLHLSTAQSLQGDNNKQQRGAEVGLARRYLNEIRAMLKVNPNFALMYPFDDDWFEQQERILRELMR